MTRLERSAHAMGTTFTLCLYGSDIGMLEQLVGQAFEEVRRLDEILSNYIEASELNYVNKHAADRPVRVSQELFDLLAACMSCSQASEGAFDVTVGPLMKVWGFYRGSGVFPENDDEIRAALEVVGYQRVELNAQELTIRFKRPGVNLDLGGVGKGYAVDRIAAMLRDSGALSAVISAGGSAIHALGAPPTNPSGWPIQIRHPELPYQTACEVCLKDASLATSGSSEQYFWKEGKRYSHLLDPRTGWPCQGMLSVTVIAPRAVDAEIWAKPYFVLGRAWARRHKVPAFRVFVCEEARGSGWEWLA